jgi:acyl-coenzyme A thioesterase PaaI-like protein
MSQLLELYRAVGNERYAKEIAKIAPYFGTIDAQFKELRPGYCALVIPNRAAVHNHLGTLHAIAMCNGVELAAGLTTDVSIPGTRRWIPVAMTVRYLGMAKTDVHVECDGRGIDWSTMGDVVVPVAISDLNQKPILAAEVTMKISEKKPQGTSAPH